MRTQRQSDAVQVPLPSDTDIADLLDEFDNVGAYTRALASSFNGFPRPLFIFEGLPSEDSPGARGSRRA